MSGYGLQALRIASLTAALLALSVSPPLANAGGGRGGGYSGGSGGYRGGSGGYRGDYGGYRGGYYGGRYYGGRYYGYGYGPYVGFDFGFYPYDYDFGPPYPYSAPPVIVASPPAIPTVTADAPPSAAETTDGSARVRVLVPADAEVWFNGDATKSRGEQRDFTTPALTPDKDYQYEIRARWKDGDHVVDQTRTVSIHANARVGIDFSRPESIRAPQPTR